MTLDAQTGLDQYREWSTEDLIRALAIDSDDYEAWAVSAIRAELQRRQTSPEEIAELVGEAQERVGRELASKQVQRQVDALLRRGIIFSLVWLVGVGSIIAIVSGIKAKKIIEQSGGETSGIGRAWFCLVVGGLGVLFWGPVIGMAIINNVFGR